MRTLAIIEGMVPALVIARDLVDWFHRLINARTSAGLGTWSKDVAFGLLSSFAAGVVQDRAAVQAAPPNLGQMARLRGRSPSSSW